VAEAREHILKFDWVEVARRTAEVYEDLLAGGVRPVGRSSPSGRSPDG
jgi:hypothetical protein